MAKNVLGNDPFQRGAAARAPTPHSSTKATTTKPARIQSVSAEATSAEKAPKEPRKNDSPASPLAARQPETPRATAAPQITASDAPATFPGLLDSIKATLRTALETAGIRSHVDLDPYGKDAQLERRLSGVFDFLFDRYWRIKVEGAEKLGPGASLVVANHSGALPFDGPMLCRALMRARPDLHEPRWLVEDQVFFAPLLGTLMNRLGAVRASPENGLQLLKESRPVAVFPEGIHGMSKPFQERYVLKRLGRGGFAKLAIRARVPIVPAAIIGAEEAMPLLARLPGALFGLPYLPLTTPPLPTRWVIRFGDPIVGAQVEPEVDPNDSLQDIVLTTRRAIESMLADMLRNRRSVFEG